MREDSAGVMEDVQPFGELLEDLVLSADPRERGPREPVDVDVDVAKPARRPVTGAVAAGWRGLQPDPAGSQPTLRGFQDAAKKEGGRWTSLAPIKANPLNTVTLERNGPETTPGAQHL